MLSKKRERVNEKNITALISLLDDPDEGIYSHVRNELVSYGEDVIPYLEKEWENAFGSIIQNRIELIIHKIQFDNTTQKLREWALSGGINLFEGAMLIAKYQYPDLDEAGIKSKIDMLTQDAWLEMSPRLTALEKVRVLNHIIFEVHGYSGNTKNFHAPQNNYLNNVIEGKKGNPLSLSILYSIIAQNLQIPVNGVNLPEHFILAYVNEHIDEVENENIKILFYINPFSKGSIFTQKEITAFLKQLNLEPKSSYYEPCTNLQMIKRLINNLIISYEKLGYPDKVNELTELGDALTKP